MTTRLRILAAAASAVALAASLASPASAAIRLGSARRTGPGVPPGQQSPPGNGHGGGHHVDRPPIFIAPGDLVPTCTEMTSSGETMQVVLGAPLPGTTTSSYEPDCPLTVEVAGTASVGRLLSDFYFVIDSSGSTGTCSGSDIDGDGEIGTGGLFGGCSDPDDTVLAAELKAVRDYVATLSPSVSRVAIIQFSFPEQPMQLQRQRIVCSLTSDFVVVNAALDEIFSFGSAGATDYGGALVLLMDEHLDNGDPLNRRQFCYFLSDGVPTYPVFPHGTEEPGDSQWAIDNADLAASAGIRVDTFGVGFTPSTTLDPIFPPRCLRPDSTVSSTLECIALRTGGTFFASNDPADIVGRLQQSEPAGIESVTVFNDTLGVSAVASLTPDGLFASDLPISLGEINELRVVVVAEDGTTCELLTNYLPLCFSVAGGGCAPLTQGYWHRQCMGLRLIDPDRVGGPPPHPDWEPQILYQLMLDVVDPLVAALGSPADLTACQGLDADPQDDMCQKAIKQYTAVLMNTYGGRLGPGCVLLIPEIGLVDVDPATAIGAISALIQAGLAGDVDSCKAANDAADLINTGAALD